MFILGRMFWAQVMCHDLYSRRRICGVDLVLWCVGKGLVYGEDLARASLIRGRCSGLSCSWLTWR